MLIVHSAEGHRLSKPPGMSSERYHAAKAALLKKVKSMDVSLSEHEYADLLDDRKWRLAMESAGVDNWSGYDYAMELYREMDEDESN